MSYHDMITGQQALFQGVGSVLSSATTITPNATIHHVSGIITIATITPPYAGFTGAITLIPDGAWITTLIGGNIGLASTGIVGKALTLVYDGSKWWPSY